MPKIEPVGNDVLKELLKPELFRLWGQVTNLIESRYNLNTQWHTAGKFGPYELKYQKSGKTLISLFPRPQDIGVMIIFGGKEREKFEPIATEFCPYVLEKYQGAKTYHDGKWVMFILPHEQFLKDLPGLLAIKRKPDKE